MNQSSPFVSVVLTTYNRADLLGETIASILNQSYCNFELIVVDDGSQDETEKRVLGFRDKRVKYIYSNNWGGPARPRNLGVAEARGEYIAFCDDDDLWHPSKIEKQLPHFNGKIVSVATNAVLFGNKANRLKCPNLSENILLGPGADVRRLKSTIFSSLMVRNTGLLFEEKETFKFAEDFAFLIKMIEENRGFLKLLAEPLTYYRVHSGNNVSNIRSAKSCLNVIMAYKDQLGNDRFRRAYTQALMHIAWTGLQAQSSESKKYYWQAFRHGKANSKSKIALLLIFSLFPKMFIKLIMDKYLAIRH